VRFRTLFVTCSPQALFGPSAPRLFGRSGLAPCACADNGDCQPESCFWSPQQSPLSFRHADHGAHEIHRTFALRLRYRNRRQTQRSRCQPSASFTTLINFEACRISRRPSEDLRNAKRTASHPMSLHHAAGVFSEVAIAPAVTTWDPAIRTRAQHPHVLSPKWPSIPKPSIWSLAATIKRKGYVLRKGSVPVRGAASKREHGRPTRPFPVGWARRVWMTLLWLASAAQKRSPDMALPDACGVACMRCTGAKAANWVALPLRDGAATGFVSRPAYPRSLALSARLGEGGGDERGGQKASYVQTQSARQS
jgi:hypothetical protein